MHLLGPRTTLADVSKWKADTNHVFRLSIKRNAHFAPCVEAIALAKATDFFDAGVKIHVKLVGDPIDCSSADAIFQTGPPVLSEMFGLHLAYLADSFVDVSGQTIKEAFLEALWQEVGRREQLGKNNQRKVAGTITGRKKVSIVCRDPDNPIPECLRESEAIKRPSVQKFRSTYLNIVASVAQGNSFRLPASNNDLITFLFESFANAHEHGRLRHNRNSQCLVRGIVFERISLFTSEIAEARQDLEGPLRDYVIRMRAANDPAAGFLAITVSDLGVGIQNTLATEEDEDDWRRLNRAFKVGQSCKPKGEDIQRGKGLDDVLQACETLKALLLVHSGPQFGYFDGSASKRSDKNSLFPYGSWNSLKLCGTSLTLVFPSFTETAPYNDLLEQQETLF